MGFIFANWLLRVFTENQRTLLELLADEFKDANARRIMNLNTSNR